MFPSHDHIGAAIITPSVKGPVGIPTTVTTYSDYKTRFGSTLVSGGVEYAYFGNISAQNYFKQGGSNLTVIRVVSGALESWDGATSTSITTGSNAGTGTNNVFTLKTISEGSNQNSNSTETTGGALPSGSADNLRWEITNVDSGSGIFTLNIRQGNDRQADKTILESWRGVSLDPKRDD